MSEESNRQTKDSNTIFSDLKEKLYEIIEILETAVEKEEETVTVEKEEETVTVEEFIEDINCFAIKLLKFTIANFLDSS